MKIIFTSDTHNCPRLTTTTVIENMAKKIRAQSPDLLVVGGDIGETRINIKLVSDALTILGKEIPSKAAFAGNHDLWVNLDSQYTSLDLWNNILPQICKDKKWHWLEHRNWIKNNVAVVGSYLHYDYSSQDTEGCAVNFIKANFPDWTMDEYYERMKKNITNDGRFFKGLPRDKDFAEKIGKEFIKRLLQAENNPDINSIIILTHVPCMPSQITRKPNDFHWSSSTAYFGNLSHTKTIMDCSKIKYVISGHSHQAHRHIIKFNDGHPVTVINLGSDYGNPIFETLEV